MSFGYYDREKLRKFLTKHYLHYCNIYMCFKRAVGLKGCIQR